MRDEGKDNACKDGVMDVPYTITTTIRSGIAMHIVAVPKLLHALSPIVHPINLLVILYSSPPCLCIKIVTNVSLLVFCLCMRFLKDI